jgi:hypothetical protein
VRAAEGACGRNMGEEATGRCVLLLLGGLRMGGQNKWGCRESAGRGGGPHNTAATLSLAVHHRDISACPPIPWRDPASSAPWLARAHTQCTSPCRRGTVVAAAARERCPNKAAAWVCAFPLLQPPCLPPPGATMDAARAATAPSLPYHEPAVVTILVQSSLLLLLNLVNALLDRLVYCGLLGQVLLGIAWGTPGAKWLSSEAEEVMVQLGYLGLVLLVYEGI